MDSVQGILLRADKFTKALVEIPSRTRINLQGETARMDVNLTGLVKGTIAFVPIIGFSNKDSNPSRYTIIVETHRQEGPNLMLKAYHSQTQWRSRMVLVKHSYENTLLFTSFDDDEEMEQAINVVARMQVNTLNSE